MKITPKADYANFDFEGEKVKVVPECLGCLRPSKEVIVIVRGECIKVAMFLLNSNSVKSDQILLKI